MLQHRLPLTPPASSKRPSALAICARPRLGAQRSRLETSSRPQVTCAVSRRELIGGASGLLGSTGCPCPACSATLEQKISPSLMQRFFAYYMATSMGEYEEKVSPWKQELFSKLLQGKSEQRVIELGLGTGPNLKYMASALQDKQEESKPLKGLEIVGVDPNTAMQPYARQNAQKAGLEDALSFVQGQAESIPFESNSFDSAVVTLVLCSVKDPQQAVNELLRVLRPGGRCLFIEHVAAPWETQPSLRAQQTLLNPLQRVLADGCSLTRDTRSLLEGSAWSDCYLISENVQGMGLVAPHVRGIAVK